MRALIKEGRVVAVRDVPKPEVTEATDVVIRVRAAAICRTDVYAAEGRIPTREPVILGHELSGIVEEAGPSVKGIERGARVTVMPALACKNCSECIADRSASCANRQMLGVHLHGGFAEWVKVPAGAVHALPAQASFSVGAWAEPVAASLAVLKAGIERRERGLIWGRNRIALLTERVLRAHGFDRIELAETTAEASAFDFVIETGASTAAMKNIVRAVRPGGRVVLKSRAPDPVGIDFAAAIAKELVFAAVGWGSLSEAIDLLADRRVIVDDLIGPVFALDSFEEAFRASKAESMKPYFAFEPPGR